MTIGLQAAGAHCTWTSCTPIEAMSSVKTPGSDSMVVHTSDMVHESLWIGPKSAIWMVKFESVALRCVPAQAGQHSKSGSNVDVTVASRVQKRR